MTTIDCSSNNACDLLARMSASVEVAHPSQARNRVSGSSLLGRCNLELRLKAASIKIWDYIKNESNSAALILQKNGTCTAGVLGGNFL